jgi:hypothetical protein
MKAATLALVVQYKDDLPLLVDIFSDDKEIGFLETKLQEASAEDPLQAVYSQRELQAKEEEEFGDYIEDLLSHPFVRPEVQEHAVAWFKSKIRIEKYQKAEAEAAKVIAEYAYQVFRDDPSRRDFMLSGPTHVVRVRIFVLGEQRPADVA